jgi:hypothetical protein
LNPQLIWATTIHSIRVYVILARSSFCSLQKAMNIVTALELSGDGAPLLRTGAAEDEEFLIKAFPNVAVDLSAAGLAEGDASLPATSAAGELFVTTRSGSPPSLALSLSLSLSLFLSLQTMDPR